jgi:hypothetical protein
MKTMTALKLVIPLIFTALLYADELPYDLKILNDRRALKIEQINETYKSELIKLQAKYTKAADPKAANLVQSYIDEISKLSVSVATPPAESSTTMLPKSQKNLEEFLIGSSWSIGNTKAKDGFVFNRNGEFKSKERTLRYMITGPKSVVIIWSPSMSISCEFSEDFTFMKELSHARNVFKYLGRVQD